MSTVNVRLKDASGNILHPETDWSLVQNKPSIETIQESGRYVEEWDAADYGYKVHIWGNDILLQDDGGDFTLQGFKNLNLTSPNVSISSTENGGGINISTLDNDITLKVDASVHTNPSDDELNINLFAGREGDILVKDTSHSQATPLRNYVQQLTIPANSMYAEFGLLQAVTGGSSAFQTLYVGQSSFVIDSGGGIKNKVYVLYFLQNGTWAKASSITYEPGTTHYIDGQTIITLYPLTKK